MISRSNTRKREAVVKPSGFERVIVDFGPRVHDSEIDSPRFRWDIPLNPEPNVNIVNNRVTKTLAAQMSYTGKDWSPSVGDINEVPFAPVYISELSNTLYYWAAYTGLQYKGVIKNVFAYINDKDSRLRINHNGITLLTPNLSLSSDLEYVTPSILNDAGGETNYFKLIRYDEVNDFYVIELKGIIAFDHFFSMTIQNRLGSGFKCALSGDILKIS